MPQCTFFMSIVVQQFFKLSFPNLIDHCVFAVWNPNDANTCTVEHLLYKPPHPVKWINVNVNVYVYSLISHWVQQTSQFTPLVLELSLVRSHLLWGEFSAFSAAIVIHNSPLFVPPGTHHCWVDRGGMIWKACPTPLHMAGSVTRAPVTHPSTNRARRCLTSVIQRELVTTRPCAIMNLSISGKKSHWWPSG